MTSDWHIEQELLACYPLGIPEAPKHQLSANPVEII